MLYTSPDLALNPLMLNGNFGFRLFLLTFIAVVFGYTWQQLNEITLYVIGQPSTIGPLQSKMEEPFFATLRQKTGLPLEIRYRPLNETGLIGSYQLKALKEGVIDIASLRFIQNSKAEPALGGVDLPGLIQDFDTAKLVSKQYKPMLDNYLQNYHKAKLLGLWSFGPQQVFCKHQVNGINDFSGLKIRVPSVAMSPLISKLGGIPAVIPFDDTRQALAIGLVDCAITSIVSAHSAEWTKYASYYLPLAFGHGINGYVISMKKWNVLSASQQLSLQIAINKYLDKHWNYSEMLYNNAKRCLSSGSCQEDKSSHI